MTKKKKKIINLAETLYSITQVLNYYCKSNDGEDIHIIKGCVKQISRLADDLYYYLI